MSATPDSTLTDLQQINADLRCAVEDLNRKLDERTAERDQYKAERDDALAQQTATAEVLGVINSSPGDLKPVFEAMLEKALSLCGASFGLLAVLNDNYVHVVAERGIPAALSVYHREPYEVVPDTPMDRFLRGEQILHIPDLLNTPYKNPRRQPYIDLGGARSVLAIPLRKDLALLGCFVIYRQKAQAFSDKQISLLQNFAAQAVIAMENARLITETREALEQQTATAEVLQVINSSPGDLSPVFDAMLENAMRLSQGAYGHVYLYDGERYHTVAVDAEPHVANWLREYGPFQPRNYDSPLGRLVAGARMVRFGDAREDPGYNTNPGFRTMVDTSGARSGITVALDKDGALQGAISIYRREVRPFSDRQVALLQNFAAQAVIAIENARLITETREALEQQTATAEVLGIINSSPGDLTPVFDAMLVRAHNLCGSAHGALVLREGERFRAVATHGLPKRLAELLSTPHRTPGPQDALLDGSRIVEIPDLRSLDAPPESVMLQAVIELTELRSTLFVPMRRDDVLLGYITAYREEARPFSDKEIGLLENFAAQAVIAMENTRLITETREALEQQTATAEVLQVINSSPGDLAPVFDAMVGEALRLCEAAYGHLNIYDGERFCPVASQGEPKMVEWLKQRGPVRAPRQAQSWNE